MVQVGAVADARPQIGLLVGALWCDEGDILNDVFDIAVRVLFHATSSRRDPAAKG